MKNILPDSISGRYLIKKRIGKGGMGYVYLAEDVELMRNVAIKTIRPELVKNSDVRKRIERECKMHATIQVHPNIIALYDRVTDDNNIFLIMEYVEGRVLSEIISKAKENNQRIPVKLIVNIVLQLLEALSCTHRYNIIHRDIKPSNIIIGGLKSSHPYAKLMDFGIARGVLEDESLTKLTTINSGGPGTPVYMAPERIDSKTYGDICLATDLYSVGIILYELFCLKPPFHGTMTEVFSGHISRQPDLSGLAHHPETLQNVIIKALNKKPEDRYPDAQTFANDLKAAGLMSSEGGDGSDETLAVTSFDPKTPEKTVLDTTYSPVPSFDFKTNKKFVGWGAGLFTLIIFAVGIYFFKHSENAVEPTVTSTESANPIEENNHSQIPEPVDLSGKAEENVPSRVKNKKTALEAFEEELLKREQLGRETQVARVDKKPSKPGAQAKPTPIAKSISNVKYRSNHIIIPTQ